MTGQVKMPILVIGTHRSGTTLLGRALGHHPEVAYWEEPRHVWSWGHNFRPDDLLTAADATPRIKSHIQRCCQRFLISRGKARLADKTPSNCLRMAFVHEIFPDALFLHIFRDGRAVVHSTDTVVRTRMPDTEWYARRLLGTPVWEWPALLPRAWRTLGRRLLGADMKFWGPQPPGWRQWLKEDSRLMILAKQWRYTIEPVLDYRSSIPPSQWLDIRYEDLVTEPAAFAGKIAQFARLTRSSEFENHLERECRRDRIDAWRSHLGGGPLEEMRPVLKPILERLGYQWETHEGPTAG